MKVVIQNKITRSYLKSSKTWTDVLDEAKNFGYFERAARFVHEQRLSGVQFAVPVSDPDEVLVFPVL